MGVNRHRLSAGRHLGAGRLVRLVQDSPIFRNPCLTGNCNPPVCDFDTDPCCDPGVPTGISSANSSFNNYYGATATFGITNGGHIINVFGVGSINLLVPSHSQLFSENKSKLNDAALDSHSPVFNIASNLGYARYHPNAQINDAFPRANYGQIKKIIGTTPAMSMGSSSPLIDTIKTRENSGGIDFSYDNQNLDAIRPTTLTRKTDPRFVDKKKERNDQSFFIDVDDTVAFVNEVSDLNFVADNAYRSFSPSCCNTCSDPRARARCCCCQGMDSLNNCAGKIGCLNCAAGGKTQLELCQQAGLSGGQSISEFCTGAGVTVSPIDPCDFIDCTQGGLYPNCYCVGGICEGDCAPVDPCQGKDCTQGGKYPNCSCVNGVCVGECTADPCGQCTECEDCVNGVCIAKTCAGGCPQCYTCECGKCKAPDPCQPSTGCYECLRDPITCQCNCASKCENCEQCIGDLCFPLCTDPCTYCEDGVCYPVNCDNGAGFIDFDVGSGFIGPGSGSCCPCSETDCNPEENKCCPADGSKTCEVCDPCADVLSYTQTGSDVTSMMGNFSQRSLVSVVYMSHDLNQGLSSSYIASSTDTVLSCIVELTVAQVYGKLAYVGATPYVKPTKFNVHKILYSDFDPANANCNLRNGSDSWNTENARSATDRTEALSSFTVGTNVKAGDKVYVDLTAVARDAVRNGDGVLRFMIEPDGFYDASTGLDVADRESHPAMLLEFYSSGSNGPRVVTEINQNLRPATSRLNPAVARYRLAYSS